jgi:ferredoxin
MPRGDVTGPLGAGGRGRGRGGGRGMGRGRGPGRRMRRVLRADRSHRTLGFSNVPRAAASAKPAMLGPLKEDALAMAHLDTVGSREAAQRPGNLRSVARVDEAACTLCGACQAVCPTEAITLGETAVQVNAEICCGCGACVEVCPNGAIRLG